VQYSPARRTALVFCGTGAHGAYHAGVLRALQEAGVKIDVVAGHGIGAGAATLAAIDGGARLWEPDGVWRSSERATFYHWTRPIQIAGWLTLLLVTLLIASVTLLVLGFAYPLLWLRAAVIVVVGLALILVVGIAEARLRRRDKRRTEGPWWWAAVGAPLDAEPIAGAFFRAIWQLTRGAAPAARPPDHIAARRYSEMLAENLGQPGFCELMVVATDLEARSDVVAAMLREPYRHDFIAPRPGRERRAEVLDLAGLGRDHGLEVMAAAMTPPVACDPRLVTFAADGYWRGETHRLCDRPGSIARLLEELAAAGVSQAIIVNPVPAARAPHRLRTARLDVRGRLGEFITAAESASLHDALDLARLRFDSFYVICPSHNPVGPFDCTGAYDEASDRRHSTEELMERAYEDAYQQFIDPVVGASGEHLVGRIHRAATGRVGASAGQANGQGILDDADPQR
jgi:hypothetical protein